MNTNAYVQFLKFVLIQQTALQFKIQMHDSVYLFLRDRMNIKRNNIRDF